MMAQPTINTFLINVGLMDSVWVLTLSKNDRAGVPGIEFCNVFHTTKQQLNLAFCYFKSSMSSSEDCFIYFTFTVL